MLKCLKLPIIAVGMITASEVPTASLMSIFMKNIMAGTMTIPPPTPNNPLVTPLTAPINAAIKYCMRMLCHATAAAHAFFGSESGL